MNAPSDHRRFDDVPPAEPARAAKHFEMIFFDDVVLSEDPNYVVKGIFPRRGLAVVWGPPKCGKSFWVSDLALHVALGWQYRGRRVQQGTVVYCALEGAEGFKARLEAFRRHKLAADADPVPFILCPTPLDLVADHVAFVAAIRAALQDADLPRIIVVDTVNRSLAGSESDDGDMGRYIKAAEHVGAAFGCLVIVVHHSGVDASRPRGHTSLAGAVDAQVAVKKVGVGALSATVEHAKDGPEGDQVFSRLVSVEIGMDRDGDPITSCIVEAEASDAVPVKAEKPRPKLTDGQKLALNALHEAIGGYGEAGATALGLPKSARVVSIARWREELVRRGVLDLNAKNPRTEFNRLRDGLCAKGYAASRDDRIWPQ